MKIEIVAIGDEILNGFTVNSNACFISKQLNGLGITTARHTVLPDDKEHLKNGLKEALARADIVITTGGLGPTGDDITRSVVAEIFSSPLKLNKVVAAHLLGRYGQEVLSLEDQATIPEKALPWLNEIGTAPALLLEVEDKTLILLPGVPAEMKAFCLSELLPFIKKKWEMKKQQRPWRKILHFYNLAESKIDPYLRKIVKDNSAISYGIYPNNGLLTVHLITHEISQQKAFKLLEEPFNLLKNVFNSNFLSVTTNSIEEEIQKILVETKQTLSVAESCTGGALSARLSAIAGASSYFLGGVVAYSNLLKENFLNVPREILASHGAVSSRAVEAMAQGILQQTQSDWSLAVSGIAGPDGGTEAKPVGTVWAAIAEKGKPLLVWSVPRTGKTREMVIARSVNNLLATFLALLQERLST